MKMFEANDYLGWYIPRMLRGDGAINLHASGVEWVHEEQLAPVRGVGGREAVHAFEAALAAWLGIAPAELVFTPGATGGTLLALLSLASRDDEIVVEAPIYEPMLRQAHRLAVVRTLRRTHADGWQLPLDAARELIGERTGLVLITEPHNPSGVGAPREQVLELARIAADAGARVLINEIYRGYSDSASYHRAAENIVVVSSLSKLCGAYGARLGWLSCDAELATRLRTAHFNMGMPPHPGARAGLAFMERADELRQRAIAVSAAGVEIVDAWVRATAGVDWHRPAGPGFGCLALPDGVDDLELAERLHDDLGVLTVPGYWFQAPGTLRISWLQSGDRLAEGLDRLARALG